MESVICVIFRIWAAPSNYGWNEMSEESGSLVYVSL